MEPTTNRHSTNLIYPSYSAKSHFTTLAHGLMTPLWFAEEHLHRCFLPLIPGQYGQCENRVQEIVCRFFHLVWSIPAVLTFLPFHLVGNVILKILSSPTDIEVLSSPNKTSGPLQENISLFQWNLCAMRGSLPLPFGGMTPVRDRFGDIMRHILSKEADVVALSEIDPLEADRVARGLQGLYEKVYYRFGISPLGMSSCLLVAVKKESLLTAGEDVEYHPLPLPEQGAQKAFQRGFFVLPAGGYKIVFTHLHPGHSPADVAQRALQLGEIEKYQTTHLGTPLIIMGDFNIDTIHHGDEYDSLIRSKRWASLGELQPTVPTAIEDYEHTLKRQTGEPLREHIDHIVSTTLLSAATTIIDPSPRQKTGTHFPLSDHASLMTTIPMRV